MEDPVAHLCAALGEDRLRALVAAFYARVREDDLLGPMYPEADMAGAEARLAAFVVQRCGGPPEYERMRGHPRLRMRHARFAIDRRARDRWMACMDGAFEGLGIEGPGAAQLRDFLDGVASFLINRQ